MAVVVHGRREHGLVVRGELGDGEAEGLAADAGVDHRIARADEGRLASGLTAPGQVEDVRQRIPQGRRVHQHKEHARQLPRQRHDRLAHKGHIESLEPAVAAEDDCVRRDP
eukprot:7379129-Prymnesium_polylepis.1